MRYIPKYPFTDIERIHKQLKAEGFKVGHNKVHRLMRLIEYLRVVKTEKSNTQSYVFQTTRKWRVYPLIFIYTRIMGLSNQDQNQVWDAGDIHSYIPGFNKTGLFWYSHRW